MTISYSWLSEYLPVNVDPERLSRILTSIGLEVESMDKHSSEGYEDTIYEIGLTPNRMDAMSHLGVAKDVTAYLIHHDKKALKVKTPFQNNFKPDNTEAPVEIRVENEDACPRYAGITISDITVKESPDWLKNRLKAIGLRPINNIVDITNYILHETGQPLHAFDLAAIKGNKVVIRNMPAGTPFVTLDEKERKLSDSDLMICNESAPMCIGGVFGGSESGVKDSTTAIFLESAWFNPRNIRKTSIYHGLRTDAATRFEKGVDISNTVEVLKRAALLIRELAGGKISSAISDIYPHPKPKTEVALKYQYLKKLSGKNYHPDTVKKILEALGFELIKDSMDEIWMKVPYSKPDISIGADIVEEILRIDGLDNVEIPHSISISPSVENSSKDSWKEKVSGYLVGQGFNEMLTNSITNSAFYDSALLKNTVGMMNSLSAELNVLRPSMLETGLQSVAHNLNRRQNDLRLFEFGKTYHTSGTGSYSEVEHLCLYVTGNLQPEGWKTGKPVKADIYYLKGIAERLLQLAGLPQIEDSTPGLLSYGPVEASRLKLFDIKQPVFFVDINWDLYLQHAEARKIKFRELPKQLPVYRDLAIVLSKSLPYETIERTVRAANLEKLTGIRLFDIFENDKLGNDKKSVALSFTFLDEEKTLTDKEVDEMMGKIMSSFEKELAAEIRK